MDWFRNFNKKYLVNYSLVYIAFATRSDTVSHNRLDLIQSLVPTHYVYNGYVQIWFIFSIIWLLITQLLSSNVSTATSCDAVCSHNRRDLIQSLCNKFI
jgi:hypothetical protein